MSDKNLAGGSLGDQLRKQQRLREDVQKAMESLSLFESEREKWGLTPDPFAGCQEFDNDPALEESLPGGLTPSLYALPKNAVLLQDLIEYRNMNFSVGNVFKACYRLGRKNGVDQAYDLRKIIFFAERELRRIEGYPQEAADA